MSWYLSKVEEVDETLFTPARQNNHRVRVMLLFLQIAATIHALFIGQSFTNLRWQLGAILRTVAQRSGVTNFIAYI